MRRMRRSEAPSRSAGFTLMEMLVAVGVLAISGPSVRLTEAKMKSLAPSLLTAAADIAAASSASPLLTPSRLSRARRRPP